VQPTLLMEFATSLPLVWQTHLRVLMNNGRTVEALSTIADDTPWLLSTQT